MYLIPTNTTTEVQAIIGMVQYYIYIFPRRSNLLSPLAEVASIPKIKKI